MNRDELLGRLGLQTRTTSTDYLLPAFGLFGAGMIVGAGVALLITPKSGRELRGDVAERASRLRERFRRGNVSTSRAFEEMSRDELYEEAQSMGITGRSEMTKEQLLEAVQSA